MIYQAATCVEIPILNSGRNYFPDIQKILKKKIKAISLFKDQESMTSGCSRLDSSIDSYLSLSEDGSSYFIDNVPLSLFDESLISGQRIAIDRVLSVQDCFVEVPDQSYVGRSVILVLWYEHETYCTGIAPITDVQTDNLEIPIKANGNEYTCSYLPDVRTLADKKIENIFLSFPKITPNFGLGISEDDIDAIYFSLVKGSFAVLDRVPLRAFAETSHYFRTQLNGLVFDLVNSMVEVSPNHPSEIKGNINLSIRFHN